MNTRLKMTVGIVVFTLIAAVGWYLTLPDSPKESPESVAGDATPSTTSDPAQRQTQRENDLALARAEYMRVIRTAEDARSKLDTLDEMVNRWETDIVPLLTNDDGKHIASNDEQVHSFRAIFSQIQLPKAQESNSLRSELDTLLSPLQAALASDSLSSLPNPQIVERIDSIASEVDALSKPLTETIPQLQAMVSVAVRNNPMASDNLQTKFAEIAAAEAAATGAQLAKAREEELTKTRKMQEEQERIRQAEIRRKEEQRLAAQRETERARIAKQELIDLVNQPDVRAKLAPFIQNSISRPRTARAGRYGKPILRWETASAPEPMSYDAIRVYGVLDGERDEQKARERLQSLANHPSNTRTPWPIPQDDWKAIEEVRQLLIKLGPTLVELGYLREN